MKYELDGQGRIQINKDLTIFDIEFEKNELTWSADYNEDVYTQKQVEEPVEKVFNELVPDAIQMKAFKEAHN